MHLDAKKFSKMSHEVLVRYLLPTCLLVAAGVEEVRAMHFVRNLLLRLSLDRKFQTGTCFSFSLQLLLRSILVVFKNVPYWRPGCQEALGGRRQGKRGDPNIFLLVGNSINVTQSEEFSRLVWGTCAR